MSEKSNLELGEIPNKLYFTIGEVGELSNLEPHVLRYWEQEFSQLQPVKRSGRRYYQRADVELVRKIRNLLYDQGLTIKGARKHLDNTESVSNQQDNKTDKDSMLFVLEQLENLVATHLN